MKQQTDDDKSSIIAKSFNSQIISRTRTNYDSISLSSWQPLFSHHVRVISSRSDSFVKGEGLVQIATLASPHTKN